MAPVCVNATHSILSFMTCFEILKLFVVDETLKEKHNSAHLVALAQEVSSQSGQQQVTENVTPCNKMETSKWMVCVPGWQV